MVAGIGLAASAAPAAAATYRVPRSIASDCSADVTSRLLSWFESVPDNSTLSFRAHACYRIDGTLELSSRRGLHFVGNGATFKSFAAPLDTRAVWRIWQSTGMSFRDMTITGAYTQGGTFTSTLQHGHGFDLRGTQATITHVTIDDVAGDCVYFGLGSDNTTRSSGSFRRSICARTSRNAVSITAGSNILVRHVATSAIGYDVFDVEPNAGSGNWGATHVTFDHNTIGSYAQVAYSVVPNAPTSDLAFTHNRLRGVGLKIATGFTSDLRNRPREVLITDNHATQPEPPAALDLDSIDGVTVIGNTIPMMSGPMATLASTCGISISDNRYPGGTSEESIAPYSCSASSAAAHPNGPDDPTGSAAGAASSAPARSRRPRLPVRRR